MMSPSQQKKALVFLKEYLKTDDEQNPNETGFCDHEDTMKLRIFLIEVGAVPDRRTALPIKKTLSALSSDLKEWPLSVRTGTVLHHAGIKTKELLLAYSANALLRIPNFGRKSLKEIEMLIAPLSLAPPDKSTQMVERGAESCK